MRARFELSFTAQPAGGKRVGLGDLRRRPLRHKLAAELAGPRPAVNQAIGCDSWACPCSPCAIG